MNEEDHQTHIERLKNVYRDFLSHLSILRSKRDRILDAYEREIEARVQARLRDRIDPPSV